MKFDGESWESYRLIFGPAPERDFPIHSSGVGDEGGVGAGGVGLRPGRRRRLPGCAARPAHTDRCRTNADLGWHDRGCGWQVPAPSRLSRPCVRCRRGRTRRGSQRFPRSGVCGAVQPTLGNRCQRRAAVRRTRNNRMRHGRDTGVCCTARSPAAPCRRQGRRPLTRHAFAMPCCLRSVAAATCVEATADKLHVAPLRASQPVPDEF